MLLINSVKECEDMSKKLTIGVLIGNANSPHAKMLMRGIYDAAEKMDVNLIFFLGVHMTSYFREYLGTGTENRYDYQYNIVYDYANISDVDGLIISYGSLCIFLEDKDKYHFLERFSGIPYVLVEERDEKHQGSCIISDNYNGMYGVVEHLICEHNCRKICFVAGPDNNTDAAEREQAFRDALTAHNIDFPECRYAKGDYSQCCDRQIGELLDRNPDADAIVCANDVMADTAYQECAKRGLVVGKDIAVTGYDDWEMAESMLPPLTTVLQNELDMGYESVEQIIALCKGNPPIEKIAAAHVKIRESCGCRATGEYHFRIVGSWEEVTKGSYQQEVIEEFAKKTLNSQISAEIRQEVMKKLGNILKFGTEMYQYSDSGRVDHKELMENINDLFSGKTSGYVSSVALVEGINAYIKYLFAYEEDENKVRTATEVAGMLQQYIHSSVITRNNGKENQNEQDTMFVPLISRDMLSHIDDEKAFYKAPMYILNVLRVKSAYLYMLDYPHKHGYGEKWKCPAKLNLVSYLENGKSYAYDKDKRPVISATEGVVCHYVDDRKRMMTALSLFLGEEQYGILLVEARPEDMLLMHLVSMQISSALNFYYLYQQQARMQKRLEMLVDEVNEKNKILGFISTNDELTGILNRRGFMEKAMELIHTTDKKDAILFIADLDHLKEINDCFGHVSGDYAIRTAAEILQEAFGKDTLLARIGGDEFVAVIPYDYRMDGEVYINKIRTGYQQVNETSGKDFYVEMSVGYTVFRCDSSVDFNYILSQSDRMLYEAKRARRTSIRKEK